MPDTTPQQGSGIPETIQLDVQPGHSTSEYYIPVCNLPFGIDQSELEAWISEACRVIDVRVFPWNSSGWIRVQGRRNFKKALRRCNDVQLNGQIITASDRNRTEVITIRDFPSPPRPRAPPPSTILYASGLQPESQPGSPQQPSASYGLAMQYYVGMYPQAVFGYGYPTYPGYYPAPTLLSQYGSGGMIGDATPATAPPGVLYPPQDGLQMTLPDRSIPQQHGEIEQPHEYRVTERRKIFIRPFPQHHSVENVKTWIRRASRDLESQISKIEVPTGNNSPCLRGHALVTWRTTTAAEAAIHRLRRTEYIAGSRLNVRLTKEGVTSSESRIPSGPNTLESGRNGHGYHSRNLNPRALSWSSSSSGPSSGQSYSSSSHGENTSHSPQPNEESASASSSTRRRSSDPGSGSGTTVPLIVNGTTHQQE